MRPLLIAGPTGAGKTSIAASLVAGAMSPFRQVVTTTTREASRDGEAAVEQPDGSLRGAYIHRSHASFNDRAARGEFLEYERVGEHYYGLERAELDRVIADGKIPVVVQTPSGILAVRESLAKAGIACNTIYLDCSPSWSTQVVLNRYRAELRANESADNQPAMRQQAADRAQARIEVIQTVESQWPSYKSEFDHVYYNGPDAELQVITEAIRAIAEIDPAPVRAIPHEHYAAAPGGR